MKRCILPRFQDILFFGIFTAALLLGPRMLNQDGDLPRHLAMGRYVLQHGLPPTQDIFSHTNTGKPFAPHEWLAGLIFYIIFSVSGLNGLVLLSAFVLAGAFTLVYRAGLDRSNLRLPVIFLTLLGAAVSSLHWIIRPHLFTMLFLIIWLIMTDKLWRGETTRTWPFPVLMLFWSNIHGEFIAGFLVLAAYLAGWCWDAIFRPKSQPKTGEKLLWVSTLSFLATLINPVGLRTWGTVLGYVNNKYLTTHTNETIPPDFTQAQFLVLLALLCLSIFLLAIKKGSLSTPLALLLAGFSAMSLIAARNVHLYGIVAPFVLASTFTEISFSPLKRAESVLAEVESHLAGVFWPVAITLSFSFVLIATPLRQINQFDPRFYPVEAVKWLKSNPQPGEMFNAFNWGGYLIFNLWPEKRVFIDSQTDVYGDKFTQKYEQVITLTPGWQGVLDEYHVRWVLINTDWPLANALAAEGWREVYHDATAVIYSR